MDLDTYLRGIRSRLIRAHHDLIGHTMLAEQPLNYRPENGGWSIREVIEHVSLTSYYLLIIIDKSAAKARRKATEAALAGAKTALFNPSRLDSIGEHQAFPWSRPDHMEPTGSPSLGEITDRLTNQLTRCLVHLEELKDGAGLLHTTTMTVDSLGRLNTYEYIDFLARHAERHLQQIAKIQGAYAGAKGE